MKAFSLILLWAINVAYTTPVKAYNLCSTVNNTVSPPNEVFATNEPCSREHYRFYIRDMTCTCSTGSPPEPKREDYQYTPGLGGHKFHSISKTFNDARKICNEEGGHLAIINSDAEERILLDLAKRGDPIKDITFGGQAFIGIHDLFGEADWITIFNDSIYKSGYNKWSPGQPDNASNNEHCGALILNDSGKLNDLPCTYKQPFFCEIPASKVF